MSSPQEQYAESLRTSQAAVVDAVESWTKRAQSAFGTPAGDRMSVDPNQVIDQVFDFAEQMLAAQREFAKTLATGAASAASEVGEAVRREPPRPAAKKSSTGQAGATAPADSAAAEAPAAPAAKKSAPRAARTTAAPAAKTTAAPAAKTTAAPAAKTTAAPAAKKSSAAKKAADAQRRQPRARKS